MSGKVWSTEEREGVNNMMVSWGCGGGDVSGCHGRCLGRLSKGREPVLHLKEWGAGEGQEREQGAPGGAEAWEGPHGPPPHPQQKSSP